MTFRDVWAAPDRYLIIEKLAEARELVRTVGWCQGRAHMVIDGQDCYCPMGAVSEVCGTVRLSWPATAGGRYFPGRIVPGAWIRAALTEALTAALPARYQLYPGHFSAVALWNDVAGRERGEVVGLFTAAIDRVSRRDAA